MRIKLLDHMGMSFDRERRVVAPLDWASFSFTTEGHDPFPTQEWREYHARVEVFFKQIGPPANESKMRESAKRSIAHHMFQDVEAEIHAALREMWEAGQHDSKAAKRLEAMLPVLRGEQTAPEP